MELFGVLDKVGFNPPSEIHLFGFSYVWTGLREMIQRLSQKSRINIYTLSPCKSFWNTTVSHGHTPLWGETDGLPIVIHWGQPGKEYAQMLREMPEAGTEFHPDFVESGPASVLGRLQGEILNEEHDVNTPAEPDRSLVILGCAHIRREAEVVANEIWQLIRNDNDLRDTSRERLRFRDIAVLLVDGATQLAYQTHFRAVFEDLHGIPFNMVDLPLAGEYRVIEAVLMLLTLPLGQFTRPEMLKVLTHSSVRARFPEANTDR